LCAPERASASPVAPAPAAASPTTQWHVAEDPGKQPSGKTPYRAVARPPGYEVRSFAAGRDNAPLTRQRIEHAQPRSLPDALREVPGVFVQETNRGAGIPILRGLVGPSNLNLIDGIRWQTSTYRTGPNQYLALIDPFAIRRVNVVRGPSAVRYGNGAIGGVVNTLIVRPPDGRWNPGWSLAGALNGASADGSYGVGGHASYGSRAVDVLAGAGYRSFGDLTVGGGDVLKRSGYSAANLRLKLKVRASDTTRIIASGLYGRIDDATRTESAGKGHVRVYDNTDHFSILQLIRKTPFVDNGLRHLRIALSHHRLGETVSRDRCKTSNGIVNNLAGCLASDDDQIRYRQQNRDEVDTLGLAIRSRWAFFEGDRLAIDAGADAYRDDVKSTAERTVAGVTNARTGTFAGQADYLDAGAFVYGTLDVLDLGATLGDVSLGGGVRFAHTRAGASGNPDLGDVDYAVSGMVTSAGIKLALPDAHTIYVNAMEGLRAPNLQETVSVGNTGSKFELPNPDLKPERARTVEAGMRYRLGTLGLSMVGWRTWLQHSIDEQPSTYKNQGEFDSRPVVLRVNAGSALYSGAEATIGWRYKGLLVNGGWTWTQGDVTFADGSTSPARRVPPRFGQASIGWLASKQGLLVEGVFAGAFRQDRLHASDRKDVRICETSYLSGQLQKDCSGTPPWWTLGLRASWTINPNARIRVAATNLLDRLYRTHGSGFPAPGREVRVTLEGRM